MRSWIIPFVIVSLVGLVGCTRQSESPRPKEATSVVPQPASPAASPVVREGSHDDHSPKHGGIFFMDGNLYHHLEGTYPEPGLFRLWLYDDFTKPVDAAGTTGAIHLDDRPDTERVPLVYEPSTKALIARIDPPPALPLKMDAFVNLTNPLNGTTKESLFSFEFRNVGGEAAAPHAHGAGEAHVHGAGEAHSHGSPHGGVVASAGAEHHLELVATPGMLTLWVLDAQENTLPVDGMEASLLIQPDGASPITLSLPPMGNVHFMANSPLQPGAKAIVVATVKINGATKTARFTLGGTT